MITMASRRTMQMSLRGSRSEKVLKMMMQMHSIATAMTTGSPFVPTTKADAKMEWERKIFLGVGLGKTKSFSSMNKTEVIEIAMVTAKTHRRSMGIVLIRRTGMMMLQMENMVDTPNKISQTKFVGSMPSRVEKI